MLLARTMSRGNRIRAYYGLLARTDISQELLSMKEYDEVTMADLISSSDWGSIALSNIVTNRPGVEHLCCVVEAPFCAMDYTNDAR